MAFTIGVRVYRVSVRKKGDKEPLELGPSCEPCDLLDYVADFVDRKKEPTVETAEQRTWFFDPKKTNSIRVSHGYISYGTHGFESTLKDLKTKKAKYKREATDLEEIPLYFQLWVPSGGKYALLAFQSFQGRSCVGFVQSAMAEDFQNKHKGYSLTFKVMAPSAAIVDSAPVKSVTFLKPRSGSDSADRYFLGNKMDEVDLDLTIRAKRGKLLSRYKDLKSAISPTEAGYVIFDGVEYDGVKADVQIGKKRRIVGIYGSGLDTGLIDISETVKRDKSGHPTFESIVSEVDGLMEDFFDGIKT